MSEIGKVQNELKSTENINEIIQKANEINLQIQLIQAKKAIESGFLTEEVSKNLKEAESTIKDLKKIIKDEKLEKSLDKISTEVFWESIKLNGITWLTSLNESIKEWKIVNKTNKDLGDKINEIYKKLVLSSEESSKIFTSSEVKDILSKDKFNDSEIQKVQNFEINKRKEISNNAKIREESIKQIIINSKNTVLHSLNETKVKIKNFIEEEDRVLNSLETRMSFLTYNKDLIPSKVYYAEMDHIA